MTWRDNLREASFRGAVFYVDTSSGQFGRRKQVHEFPQRDKNYTEDLGRKARMIDFTGYVIADTLNAFDHWPARDAVIAACEEFGAGTLVHPYFGEMEGYLDVTVDEHSEADGGKAVFKFHFVEGGEFEFASDIDTYGRTSYDTEQVYESLGLEFSKEYLTTDVQGFVVADALAAFKQLAGGLAGGGMLISKPEEWRTAMNTLEFAGSNGAIYDGAKMAAAVITVIRASDSVDSLHNFSRPSVPAIQTVGRATQSNNQDAIVNLVKTAAAARRAELAINLSTFSLRAGVNSVSMRGVPKWVSRSDLGQERGYVAGVLSDELKELSALQIYPVTQAKLQAVKTSIVQHLTKLGEHLARTTTVSYQTSMPAVRVAYQHYGLLRDDEIVARNRIVNPLFIPMHSTIELLTQ